MKGWISIHRSIKDKGYYKDSRYIHLWLHLILSANHEPKEFLWNGKLIWVLRGQLLTGRKTLSEETGINESKVERILNVLKNEQQIEQQKTTKYRLITILNYNKFQKRTTERTTSEQQVNTNNNYNNENNNPASSKKPKLDKPMITLEEDTPSQVMDENGEEVLTPEKINKEKRKADTTRVIEAYEKMWLEKVHPDKSKIPRNTIQATRAIVMNALKLYSADEIISYMPYYFEEKFHEKTFYPIWVLCSKKVLNQLKIQYEK